MNDKDCLSSKKQLTLEPNTTLRLPEGFHAIAQTTQAPSLLQISNESTAFSAFYFIDGGRALNQNGEIPAGDTKPRQWRVNFNGSKLVVANVSTEKSIMLVTLIST